MNPFKRLLSPLCALLFAAALAVAAYAPANAATPNVAVGGGQVMVIPFHISGTISATQTSAVRFAMPQPCDLIGVGANARAIVGATNTLDVKVGGTTVLAAPITFAAATTYYEPTISTVSIADEAVVTVDVTIVGTSVSDITLVLTCARR